jgi:lipocalin
MPACDSAAERQWVVVSGRSAKYLWILARRPRLSTQVLARILEQVEKQGFDTDKLHFVDQR